LTRPLRETLVTRQLIEISGNTSAPGFLPDLSLSLGFGYTQQSGRIDSDINSLALPGASPFAVGGRR
jgi:hypothetical protein